MLAIAGLFFVAIITPGPNNVIVMSIAAARGFRAALPAMAGVVIGVTLLIIANLAGVGAIVAVSPVLKLALRSAGAAYLIWLGISMIRIPTTAPGEATALPTTFRGVLTFQFLNPKAWAIVLTIVSSSPPGFTAAVTLTSMLAVLSWVSLTTWASAGQVLSVWLRNDHRRRWFNRAMGALLVVFAILLFVTV